MKLLGIFAGAVLCFSPVSNAADLGPGPRKAPREPDSFVQYGGTYNWAGIYAGAFIGGVHSDWTIDFFRNNNHGHAEETSSGLAGGGWVGYNWQINPNWVLARPSQRACLSRALFRQRIAGNQSLHEAASAG